MIKAVNPIIINSLDSPLEVIGYYVVYFIFPIALAFIMWIIYWLLQYQLKNPNDPKIKLIQSVVYLEVFSLLFAWIQIATTCRFYHFYDWWGNVNTNYYFIYYFQSLSSKKSSNRRSRIRKRRKSNSVV